MPNGNPLLPSFSLIIFLQFLNFHLLLRHNIYSVCDASATFSIGKELLP